MVTSTNTVTVIEEQILAALRKLVSVEGFGSLEVVVRDHQIVRVTRHTQEDIDKWRRA